MQSLYNCAGFVSINQTLKFFATAGCARKNANPIERQEGNGIRFRDAGCIKRLPPGKTPRAAAFFRNVLTANGASPAVRLHAVRGPRFVRYPIMGGPFFAQPRSRARSAAMRLASAAATLWARLRRRTSFAFARVGHTRFVSSTMPSPVSGSMAMLVPVKPVWP